jgi:hypothetical protein
MNKSQFVNKNNLELLWEVLLDELNINKTNTNLMSNIKIIFDSNITLFLSRCNPKSNILYLNKQFLSQVLLAVNQLIPQQNINRINITDEEVLDPYKIEDIQAARQTDFEREFERKKMELENYMTPSKPKELDFTDKNFTQLEAMDSLLANKMAERNLDFTSFKDNMSTNISPEQWLTPKKTSINSEKMEESQYIMNKNQKKVSFIDDTSFNDTSFNDTSFNETSNISLKINEPTSLDIFQKLKKTNLQNDPNFTVEQTKYQQQQSIILPKQEEVLKNEKAQLNQNIQQNVPIIPNSEIIKQLNEMNCKIDKLYEMVIKLTNFEEIANE